MGPKYSDMGYDHGKLLMDMKSIWRVEEERVLPLLAHFPNVCSRMG